MKLKFKDITYVGYTAKIMRKQISIFKCWFWNELDFRYGALLLKFFFTNRSHESSSKSVTQASELQTENSAGMFFNCSYYALLLNAVVYFSCFKNWNIYLYQEISQASDVSSSLLTQSLHETHLNKGMLRYITHPFEM